MIPKRGTVYVVDDDEAVRDSVQWLLEGQDFRVRCFESAEAFLARYDPREVACMIVDLRMNGMSGLELFERLRLLAVPPPPVIFISGHADENMQRYALNLGAAAFLRKPINIDILLDHIQREMTRRQ